MDGIPMVGDDVDGMPLDVDGFPIKEPVSDLDGMPIGSVEVDGESRKYRPVSCRQLNHLTPQSKVCWKFGTT